VKSEDAYPDEKLGVRRIAKQAVDEKNPRARGSEAEGGKRACLISQPIRLTDADSRPHLQPNSILADVKLQRLDFEKKHRICSNA
jgi:hypothetical protein